MHFSRSIRGDFPPERKAASSHLPYSARRLAMLRIVKLLLPAREVEAAPRRFFFTHLPERHSSMLARRRDARLLHGIISR